MMPGTESPDVSRPRFRGVSELREALELEPFPMDRQGLYYSVGDFELSDDLGHAEPVRALLDRIAAPVFETAREAVEAVEQAFDEVIASST